MNSLEPNQASTFFSLSPESVIHMDFDVRDEELVLSSVDEEHVEETAAERRVEMDESHEPRREFHHEVRMHRVLFSSWQLFGIFVEVSRKGCLKLIGSVRSWHCRESVLRAAGTIRWLLNYLFLYGGCASAGGAGGARNLTPEFSVSKTRSRHGVFTACFAQRVFCVPVGRFFVSCALSRGWREQSTKNKAHPFRVLNSGFPN